MKSIKIVLNNTLTLGMTDCFEAAMRIELGENVADMSVDGPLAQGQLARNRLVRLAGSDQAKHLTLAARQRVALRRPHVVHRLELNKILCCSQFAKDGAGGAEFEGRALGIAA